MDIWNVLFIAAITYIGLTLILYTFASFMNQRKVKNQAENIKQLLDDIKIGKRVLFGGGLIGVIKEINNDELKINLAPNIDIEASKYSVVKVLDDNKNI